MVFIATLLLNIVMHHILIIDHGIQNLKCQKINLTNFALPPEESFGIKHPNLHVMIDQHVHKLASSGTLMISDRLACLITEIEKVSDPMHLLTRAQLSIGEWLHGYDN